MATDDEPLELLDGIATTRAIRRFLPDPIPEDDLRGIMFAATRAPSGSNRQPARFVVLTDGPAAVKVKSLIGESARRMWSAKRDRDGYDRGSGATDESPKARMAAVMDRFVERFEQIPVLVVACLKANHPPVFRDGANVYPSCQNLLLAARALGYGGVLHGWYGEVEAEVRELLELPDDVTIAATISLGVPEGNHGPVRRVPLPAVVFDDTYGESAKWALDPPGTRHTRFGPERPSDDHS